MAQTVDAADISISIPVNAAPAEQRAADELKSHFLQMTGKAPNVVKDDQPLDGPAIVLGASNAHLAKLGVTLDAAKLGDEGFVLKTVGDDLVVAGTGKRGTLYGATTLLEKLGVRWFTPTIARVPKVDVISLPQLDETQTPAFEYREPYYTESLDKDWAARLKSNGQFARLDDSTGGKLVYGAFCHTFDLLVPQDLFNAHPEYFPVIDGKRTGGYVQRCLTNPDVLKMSIERVREWMTKNPNATIFSVSQNDCHKFCECDACKAVEEKFGGKHSGVYLWFVNQIAEALEKEFPDKLIDTLAYQFTEAPPAKIKPRKNVRIRVCPIAVCEAHPYETCTAKPNVAFVKRLNKWSQVTDSLYVWHYATNFHHYLAPFPDFRQFPDSIRLYQRSGVKGIFFQGSYSSLGGSWAELRSYVMAKLLWNSNEDADARVTEWMQGVYGDAASKPMRKWFDLVHDVATKATDKHLHVHGNSVLEYFSPELIAQGTALHDEADKLAAGNAVALKELSKSRLWVEYVRIVNAKDTGPAMVQFIEDMKSHGVTCTGEPWDLRQWEQEFRAKATQK